MKYHIVSTSRTGHGAIFTNLKEAKDYIRAHPGSTYSVFDQMPGQIPPIKIIAEKIRVEPRSNSSKIIIFTDGSALGNPGPGGYGVVMITDGKTFELSQGYKYTTNNRMEMMAVINALEELAPTDRPIEIFSDSQYTINGITKGWAKNWKKKGWKKSDNKPALNPDLWSRLLDLVDRFPRLSFHWVKGHAGDPLNERADALANGAAQGGGCQLEDTGYKH
jgi:ribonuclease HI